MASFGEVFRAYSKNTSELDGRSFVKWLKDTKIVDNKCTTTDADLIFAKVKSKGSKKISSSQMEEAIKLIASKKNMDPDTLREVLCSSSGPEFKGTKPDAVKFHDDKSLYTGVHQHGGPSIVDKGRTAIADLSDIADRSSYTIRGVSNKIQNKIDRS